MNKRGDLSPFLRKELQSRFGKNGFRLHDGPEPLASFEPVCSSWKAVLVCDDTDEATVYLGAFTHVHFGNFDEDLSDETRCAQIAIDVSDFLTELFNDQIEVWGGPLFGGYRMRGTQSASSRRVFGNRAIV